MSVYYYYYYFIIVKLVTKMERLINKGTPDGQKTEHSAVGQSSDFEVYPGAVWEPVKLIREVGLGILSRRANECVSQYTQCDVVALC